MGENAASKVVKSPELPTDKQAKCKVAKSQAEPLVVEWPDTARGKLESLARRGLVAVHYEGCELQVLGRCRVKSGAYGYSSVTRKQSRITIRDADDLYASMPVGAVRLEGKLQSAGQLNVQMTIVGRYETGATGVSKDDLEGECSDATHLVAALTVGSFTFFAGADAEVAGGASIGSAGAGGRSTAARETLQRDGDEAACSRSTAADTAPPEGCGALLQIEVMPLATRTAAVVPAPVPTPGPAPTPTSERPALRPSLVPAPGPAPAPGPTTTYQPPPPRAVSRPAPDDASANGAQTPAEHDNPLRTTALYGVLGFGIASAASAAIALGQASDAKAACDDATHTCTSEYAQKKSAAQLYALIADIALGLTAASGVAFILLPAKVSVAPTRGGAVFGAETRF
jgi:hypothetical protein